MKIRRILALVLCFALLFAMSALAACKKKDGTEEEPTVEAIPTPEDVYRNMSAEQKLTTSVTKAGNAIANWEDVAAISKVLETALKSGSVQLELNLDKEITGSDQSVLLDAKLWVNEAKYALDADVTIDEEKLDLKAYIDPADRIVLDSEKILGGVYGIDMKSLASDLSVMLGSMDQIEALTSAADEYLGMIPALMDKAPQMLEKYSSLTEKELNALLAVILANVSVSSEEKSVSSMDRAIAATCITLKIDNNAVANILDGFYNNLKNDQEIAEFIGEIMAMIPADEEEAPDAVDPFAMMDQKFAATVEGIRSAEPFEFDVVISTDALGSIVRIDVNFKIREMPITISLEIAEADNELTGLRLTANIAAQEGVTITASLNVSIEKTAQGKTIRINTAGLSNFLPFDISGTIEYNKSTGLTQIRVEMTNPEAAEPLAVYEVSFIYQISSGTFRFGNLEVKVGGVVLPIPTFMLTIKENDTMPEAPVTYKNLLKLGEEEMGQLMGTVMQNVAPYAELFEGLFGKEENEPYNPDYPSEGYEWRQITEAETDDQKALLSWGYEVYECPAEWLDYEGESIDAPKGSLTSVIGADRYSESGTASMEIFYFKTAAEAEACYKELDLEDSFYQYELDGAKIKRMHIYTYGEDTDDDEQDDDEDWIEITEPQTAEQKAWLEAGYSIYACPESSIDDMGEALLNAPKGSLTGVLNVSGEDVFFDVFYFTSAELAQRCYNAYEREADFIEVKLDGNAIYRAFVQIDDEWTEEDSDDTPDYGEVEYEPALSDKQTLENDGYTVQAYSVPEILKIAETSISAEEGALVCLLHGERESDGSEITIYYFETEEKAAECYEASFKETTSYTLEDDKIIFRSPASIEG